MSITRDNLGDAVAQFLAQGGAIQACAPAEPVTKTKPVRRRRTPRASGYAESSPYDVPLSLTERQHEKDVRECVEQGFNLMQTIRTTGLSRNTILRLCREFSLELRGTLPKTPAQIIQALAEAYRAGLSHPAACNRLHLDSGEAASLYGDYQSLHPDAPAPPAVSQASDKQMLSVITLGLSKGQRLVDIAKEHGYDLRQAHTVYSLYVRAGRLL